MTNKIEGRGTSARAADGTAIGGSGRVAGELPLFGSGSSSAPASRPHGFGGAIGSHVGGMTETRAKRSTGVRRLNDVLGGGVPDGSFTLVYGPPFLGKEVLARRFLLDGLASGQPGILVLTTEGVDEARRQLTEMDAGFPAYEAAGLPFFVDAYSKPLGLADDSPRVRFVDGLSSLGELAAAIAATEAEVLETSSTHRLVFDSVSTLEAYAGAKQTFPFLQVLIGKSRRAGATGLFLLDEGMHAPAEVHTLKHLANGMIEVTRENDKSLLHVEGIGLNESLAWIEYRYSDLEFELTGTTAGGRIR